MIDLLFGSVSLIVFTFMLDEPAKNRRKGRTTLAAVQRVVYWFGWTIALLYWQIAVYNSFTGVS